jgi:hypothetical protein
MILTIPVRLSDGEVAKVSLVGGRYVVEPMRFLSLARAKEDRPPSVEVVPCPRCGARSNAGCKHMRGVA